MGIERDAGRRRQPTHTAHKMYVNGTTTGILRSKKIVDHFY